MTTPIWYITWQQPGGPDPGAEAHPRKYRLAAPNRETAIAIIRSRYPHARMIDAVRFDPANPEHRQTSPQEK